MLRSHGSRTVASAFIAAVLASSGVTAEPADTPHPIATEQLAGTVLTVLPRIDYETAVLRVSGPDDYALTRRFIAAAPVVVDMLMDAQPTDDAASGGALQLLPDGRYRYEVSFSGAVGKRRVHSGLFFVEGGSAVARTAKRAEFETIGASLRTLAGESRIGSSGAQVNPDGLESEYVDIQDTNQDGQTQLGLDSFNYPDNDADWILRNSSGDLQTYEINYGGFLRMLIEEGGQLGLGTATPLQELHLNDPDGADIQLSGSGADWILGINAGSNQFVIQDVTTVSNIFRVSQGAPNASLVIATTGVGIGTTVPAASLHVNGSGIIEGDVALGSSRTFKHEIEALDTQEVLAAVRELPIQAWKYRNDPAQARHVGPMAEDVHAAFGIGRDEKHLSPADTAGLALAAIQGFALQLDELRQKNADLAAENDILRRHLAAIELRLGVAGTPTEDDS